jgi:aminomethyltransferase
VASLAPGKARYAIACDEHGRTLMDGILIRLEPERFWYAMADGDFLGWIRAHAVGLDVEISDPRSWVAAIQGPRALDVLVAACDDGPPEPFPYFAVARVHMGGQDVLVTRTGWSGELGFEVYTERAVDGGALWDHVLAAGTPLGMGVQGLDSLGIRRIEAGILDNGTDMNVTMTPFAAGLGRFVNLDKPSFIGREALMEADRRTRLFGVTCGTVAPESGMAISVDGSRVGVVTIGAWSPRLQTGIGYARMREPGAAAGLKVTLGPDGIPGTLVDLPFVDPERRIPRGLASADWDAGRG